MTAASTTEAVPAVAALPAAGLDRRFHALVVDRALTWSLDLVLALLLWRLLAPGSVLAGLATLTVVALVVTAVVAVVQGRLGVTPGKALLGLRLVGADGGEPIGPRAALLRGLVLAAGALPTVGLGLATLAWTAVTDPDGRRRGWHDHLAGSVVVDVRPGPEPEPSEEPAPQRQVVNLTAMRLAPAPRTDVPAPLPAPANASAAVPSALAAEPVPATDRPATLSAPLSPIAAEPPVGPGGGSPTVVRTPPPASPWRVSFDTGEELRVEGPTLVGRRPEPRPGEPAARLVPLRSDDMSLSKTHAALQVAGDGSLVVTDRGSTNGTVLVRRGVTRDLPAGRASTLLSGDVVGFGDRRMTVAHDDRVARHG